MSLRYVLFRDDPSTHDEVYLTRAEGTGPKVGFKNVKRPELSNLHFDTAREGYDFAKHFPSLEYWRCGLR